MKKSYDIRKKRWVSICACVWVCVCLHLSVWLFLLSKNVSPASKYTPKCRQDYVLPTWWYFCFGALLSKSLWIFRVQYSLFCVCVDSFDLCNENKNCRKTHDYLKFYCRKTDGYLDNRMSFWISLTEVT